jgi:molybdopterin synthase sulfur carrier subunit
MQVTVQGYLTLKASLGKRLVHLDDHPPPTLQDLLNLLQAELEAAFPDLFPGPQTGLPSGRLVMLLNGQHLSHLPDGIMTNLSDGDVLSIFPPIAGG